MSLALHVACHYHLVRLPVVNPFRSPHVAMAGWQLTTTRTRNLDPSSVSDEAAGLEQYRNCIAMLNTVMPLYFSCCAGRKTDSSAADPTAGLGGRSPRSVINFQSLQSASNSQRGRMRCIRPARQISNTTQKRVFQAVPPSFFLLPHHPIHHPRQSQRPHV